MAPSLTYHSSKDWQLVRATYLTSQNFPGGSLPRTSATQSCGYGPVTASGSSTLPAGHWILLSLSVATMYPTLLAAHAPRVSRRFLTLKSPSTYLTISRCKKQDRSEKPATSRARMPQQMQQESPSRNRLLMIVNDRK